MRFAGSPGAAGGLDGWTPGELRLLPASVDPAVAAILAACEDGAPWPQPTQRVEVVLLPKPKGGPGDRRPVCLLPVLCRIWAAARRADVDAWRGRWAAAGLHAGALELSWRLAFAVCEAAHAGQELAGLAYDFQKAFD